ncbi:MAG: aminoacetone oxidase family FAD-binding enzyme [Cardiobacteriaceae bacterium]|nr:aminoacetone oxidase family FAD-binding enzyme [Cardiobacteriaceae bacterium]
MHSDILILGAGAAGLYCAIHAAARGRRVIVLEQNAHIAQKIRVSGGGRCNLTNLDIRPEAYLSHNPRFCRSALARHSQHDALAWFAAEGLTFAEKTLGQLFCEQKSRGVIAALENAALRHGVVLSTATRLEHLERDGDAFVAHSNQGIFRAEKFVIASGGPSFAKLGGSDIALRLARQFGLRSHPFRPALVPLTLNPAPSALAGASCTVRAQSGDSPVFREQLLFTHRGLSGPAILQISSYWQKGEAITLDFLPDQADDWLLQEKTQQPKRSLGNTLKTVLPAAIAQWLLQEQEDDGSRALGQYRDAQLRALQARLHRWQTVPDGHEGMAKAEVSAGGIDTRDIDPKTFMGKPCPGLHAIGEALDVTGWLGGYNFQWAWSSAWCCAQGL